MVQLRNKENIAKPPPFKLSDIRAAIPDHCFQRSLARALVYLAADLVAMSIIVGLAIKYNPSELLPAPLSWIAWCVYAIAAGSVGTGLWVIAHEGGHQSLSESELANDTIGYILHTMLMVPYFSWKISHAKHHARTGSMDEDEVFVPSEVSEKSDHPLLHSAPMRLFQIVFMLTLGWPAYLLTNVTSHKTPDFVSHYWPYCSLFSKKEQGLVILSDIGLAAWTFVLYKLACATSFQYIACMYGLPMIVVNSFLVGITALHHTNKDVPHYGSKEWNWLRGALTTVDRNYGPWNAVLHHIGDTHVAHHLFSKMPHYHAVEATACIRKVIGEYYLYDDNNIFKALWDNTLHCFAVEEKNGVYWWKSSKYTSRTSRAAKSH